MASKSKNSKALKNVQENKPSKHKAGKVPQDQDIFTKKQDPPFEDYWSREKVSEGLKNGTLIQGVLRINQNDYNECYINDPMGGPDFYIKGVWLRNRAFESDEVAIKVLPPEKWELYKVKEKEIEKKLSPPLENTFDDKPFVQNGVIPSSIPSAFEDEGAPMNIEDEKLKPTLIDELYGNSIATPTRSRPLPKTEEDYMSQGRDLRKFRRTAKVVYIVNRGHSRACAGLVKVFNKGLKLALFSPKDSRIPRVVVKLTDLPEDFSQNHKKYENTLFICRITEWPATNPFPSGQLLRSLGEAGEIEPETSSYLAEYEIDDTEFPPEVLSPLPVSSNGEEWTIPQEEIAKRRDFRNECVISIDPSSARDLDDALHCKQISPGIYEVGVHIADVSYFIPPGTPLDKIAADRATSVYLIQKVIPMLPRRLCEDLCSLNPHQDRLTLSVVWTLTLKGELISEWMGRSVICNKAKLSYDQAQQMIDDPQFPWQLRDFPCIQDADSVPEVVKSVVTLNKIAKQLRFLRELRGTLRLNQPKLIFNLDQSTGLPNGCHIYQHKESNKLIEEFMLLANMAVAQCISKKYPDISLLRRHPPPKAKALENLRDQCKTIGVSLDLSSSGDLQKSINKYHSRTAQNQQEALMEKQVLISLCCRAMELALYFCTGNHDKEENYHHYALNVPKYTHFTSPIRRYADVIVHRLLTAALNGGPPVTLDTDAIDDIASHCNKKRKNAKTVEELSSNLFLGIFIRECGPITQCGIVIAVLDKSIDVLLPELAVIRRVYCEKLSLLEQFKYELQDTGPHMLLMWKEPKTTQDIHVFSLVDVRLTSIKKSLQFEAIIIPKA